MPREHHNNDPREEIDHSPASGATDPEHATQDQAEDLHTGRHSYTENETFIGGHLPSVADREEQWTDIKDLPEKYTRETEDGEVELKPKWQSLNQANRNIQEPEQEDVDTESERSRWTKQRRTNAQNDLKMWGQQIGLTDHEIQRAQAIVSQTSTNERRYYGMNTLNLASLTLAANEGIESSNTQPKALRPQFEVPKDSQFVEARDMTEMYLKIRKTLEISPPDIREARERLRDYC